MMRKAIRLQLSLWIEGEDEPAHDFAASTTEAVRHLLADPARAHPELRIRVDKLSEDTRHGAAGSDTA